MALESTGGSTFWWHFRKHDQVSEKAIAAILGNAEVNDEKLQKVITSVESLMNSRPLTKPSDDPNDETVFTPNHFLIAVKYKLNSDLCNVNRWLRANKLTLNNEKTKFMLIALKRKLYQIPKDSASETKGSSRRYN